MQQGCTHKNIGLLARRNGVDYVRCEDCGQILEADDLEEVGGRDREEEAAEP